MTLGMTPTPFVSTKEHDANLAKLLRGYTPAQGFDALYDACGQLRPHWHEFLHGFVAQGEESIRQRVNEVQRLLHENGLTFKGRDAHSTARHWSLDPLPLLVTNGEWAEIEQGIQQWARLLNAVLCDVYGEQKVLREGWLPTGALFQHGWWWPACHGTLPDHGAALSTLGMDLICDTYGQWRVVTPRTQSPLGAGYALENRIVLARSFPRLYRDAPLRRLAGALAEGHQTLRALGAGHREHPNVVLLTAGPHSDGYLEHAYLASYLNIPLVEGQDLVVRDQRVWIRTLGGLTPVDVILRRMSDAWCDPLELRADSILGVAGLMQAVRSGHVHIANPIGSSIIEHPILKPFWPRLCQTLLGESLLMKCAESWWCGEPEGLERTLQELPQLVLYPCTEGAGAIHAAALSDLDLESLKASVLERPDKYVAERPMASATAPVFDMEHQQLVPERLSLRLFASLDSSSVEHGADEVSYNVMPGGLVWVGEPGQSAFQSSVVKDLWVLADQPQPHVSPLRQASAPLVVTRDGVDLPSRVADSLFWFGRYGERLDNRARLVREAFVRLLEQDQASVVDPSLNSLLRILGHGSITTSDPAARFGQSRGCLKDEIEATGPAGLMTLAAAVKRNAQAVRDHLGDDAWRLISNLGNELAESHSAMSGRRACERTITELAAVFGLCNETMPHHYGWRLMDIGRFLERCQNSLTLLSNALIDSPADESAGAGEMMLAATDNFTAYRRRYRSELHPNALLDLLLFDEGNPRSIGYMFKRLKRQLDRLPQPNSSSYRSEEQRLLILASSRLQLADVPALAGLPDSPESKRVLATLLEELWAPLDRLSDAISNSHFAHVETPRQLLEMQAP